MGLTLDIYRDDYRSELNAFNRVKRVTVVNADGPSDPTPTAPAAMIATNAYGDPILVPVDRPAEADAAGPMMGGTYAATSDGRLGDAIKAVTGRSFYGALAIHDRFEPWALYNSMFD